MSGTSRSVHLIRTDRALEDVLVHVVEGLGYTRALSAQIEEALVSLQSAGENNVVVVLELSPIEEDAIEAIRAVVRANPAVPVIATARAEKPELVVAALKSGAKDFVSAWATAEEWTRAIEGVFTRTATTDLGNSDEWESSLSGYNGLMRSTIEQIAWSDIPVLIQGETGSGKEVLARELHAKSQRAKKPFFKLNCAALPSELVESELFGYERGAFTGAFQRKPGIFEAADGGTILLDEIGDMDVRLQAKLLQVLQDQSFQRIGGKDMIKVNVRVIAATHRDLETAIRDGNFREDLYYRLNVVNLVVPSLRERKDRLFSLFNTLLQRHAKGAEIPSVSPELRAAMLAWDWPGNVRELENFARRLLIFREGAFLARELQKRIEKRGPAGAPGARARVQEESPSPTAMSQPAVNHIPNLAEVNNARMQAEACAILAALEATHWNRRSAAALLNTDYKCLLYRMKKLGIDAKKSSPIDRAVALDAVERVATAAAS